MKRTTFLTVLSVMTIFALVFCIVQSFLVSPLQLNAGHIAMRTGFKENIEGTNYCFCSDTAKECLPCYIIFEPEPIQ